jgi:carbamoyl-phosphate synthase large subunit
MTSISFKSSRDLAQYLRQESQDRDFRPASYRMTEDLSNCEEVILDLLRDEDGNLCFVGATGSLEPVGIDSGDSVLIKPLLTMNNDQIQVLRAEAGKIADKLQLVGFLSVHFAISHRGTEMVYKLLAVKPRLTRTAVLDQKTSLYSIGYVLAKLAIGLRLNEVTDPALACVRPLNRSLTPSASRSLTGPLPRLATTTTSWASTPSQPGKRSGSGGILKVPFSRP